MQRRNFLKDSLVVGAASLVSPSLMAQKKKAEVVTSDSKPFKLNYGIHDGMFKNSAGDNFIEQIKFAHANGFRAIEDNGMMGRSVEQQKNIGEGL
jgi:hydroxypyruvate isomerase